MDTVGGFLRGNRRAHYSNVRRWLHSPQEKAKGRDLLPLSMALAHPFSSLFNVCSRTDLHK